MTTAHLSAEDSNSTQAAIARQIEAQLLREAADNRVRRDPRAADVAAASAMSAFHAKWATNIDAGAKVFAACQRWLERTNALQQEHCDLANRIAFEGGPEWPGVSADRVQEAIAAAIGGGNDVVLENGEFSARNAYGAFVEALAAADSALRRHVRSPTNLRESAENI